jgi:hypothetical protein
MKKLGWRRGLILVAFLLAVFLAGLFTVRAVRHALYWRTHHDETIRPWMSVGSSRARIAYLLRFCIDR